MPDSMYQKIRDAVAKAADAGAHLNAASAAESIGKSLGLSNSMMQYTHIELRNAVYAPDFKKIPIKERALFLPHCSRNAKTCVALQDEEGYHCKGCGACNINDAIKLAKGLGYTKIFIVPGGSMIKKILPKYMPKAAIGVSCFNEATMAFEAAKQGGIIPQAVLLLNEGCKDTKIDLNLLEEKLSLIDDSLKVKEKKTKKK